MTIIYQEMISPINPLHIWLQCTRQEVFDMPQQTI